MIFTISFSGQQTCYWGKSPFFLFLGRRLKRVSNTCMPICYYEINQFFMSSFKIASNLFIIFVSKFNDSINMIYCAIFLFFIIYIYFLSHDILQTSRKSWRQLMVYSSLKRKRKYDFIMQGRNTALSKRNNSNSEWKKTKKANPKNQPTKTNTLKLLAKQ